MIHARDIWLHSLFLLFPLTAQATGPTDTPCDHPQQACFEPSVLDCLPQSKSASCNRDWRLRSPAMIGDFYGGSLGFGASTVQDRLIVLANDLDAPLVLPGVNSILTISEPGPVGIFSSSLGSIQQLQGLLRAGAPIPPGSLAGTVSDNAVLTTTQTVGQIQTQLASTSLPFDIIVLVPPPATYDQAVSGVFSARNTIPGTTAFNTGNSGAVIQGGIDTLTGGEDLDAYYFYDYVVRFDTALADAASGGVGRMKISEAGTVLPQDRFFFRYSYLDNVRFSHGGQQLNRYLPGFEKALLNGLASIEVRTPFAANTATVSTLNGDAFTNDSQTRFGNLTTYLKGLLLNNGVLAVSGGLGVVAPTASDIRVSYADGTPLLEVANRGVRLQPFLGTLFTPSNRIFVHSFFQHDVAASGNPVFLNSLGTGLSQAGVLTDAPMMFLDVGAGYWLYRDNAGKGLTGIVPMLELHQNLGLRTGDTVSGGPFQVGDFTGNTSLTNLVVATTLEFGLRTQLTAAYVGPIGGGVDRQFDGAMTLMLNQTMR